MEFLTSKSGKYRVGVTNDGGKIRIIASDPGNNPRKPRYAISGNWRSAVGGEVVELENFSGVPGHDPMSSGHVRLLLHWALMDRIDGRGIPCADRVVAGHYFGWWQIDLSGPDVDAGPPEAEVISRGAAATDVTAG